MLRKAATSTTISSLNQNLTRSFSSTKIYKKVWNKETGSPLLHNTKKLAQKINGQIKSPSKLKETRKSIARLKTMLGNKQNA